MKKKIKESEAARKERIRMSKTTAQRVIPNKKKKLNRKTEDLNDLN